MPMTESFSAMSQDYLDFYHLSSAITFLGSGLEPQCKNGLGLQITGPHRCKMVNFPSLHKFSPFQRTKNLWTQVVFGSCKIFSGNAIFGKGKCIQAVWLPQICFTENQFRCLVRSNILQKMLFVLRKIKLCNQNRKNKRRENLINHSTASNGKFNPIPHSYFPTNQTDPQKKQNPEKKIHQIQSN